MKSESLKCLKITLNIIYHISYICGMATAKPTAIHSIIDNKIELDCFALNQAGYRNTPISSVYKRIVYVKRSSSIFTLSYLVFIKLHVPPETIYCAFV